MSAPDLETMAEDFCRSWGLRGAGPRAATLLLARSAYRAGQERMREKAAAILTDEVVRHLREDSGPHEFCEDYGHTSLERFAEAVRALPIDLESK